MKTFQQLLNEASDDFRGIIKKVKAIVLDELHDRKGDDDYKPNLNVDFDIVGNYLEINLSGDIKGKIKVKVYSDHGNATPDGDIELELESELKHLFKFNKK